MKESDPNTQLEESLRFESLLNDISVRFVNLPAERIDAEIEDVQRLICECLSLEFSTLWQWSDEAPHFLTITHLFSQQGWPPRTPGIDARKELPWLFEKLTRGEALTIVTEEMPPEAAVDREFRRKYNLKSSVVIPLSAGRGPLIGILGFHCMKSERTWPDVIVKRLHLVAQIFANALFRKRSERELRESQARLSMAVEAAGVGLWSLEIDTGLFWANSQAKDIFHLPADETLTYQRFVSALLHRDDRERVSQAVQASMQSDADLGVEYRIVLPDGSIRWILSKGKRRLKPTGEAAQLMGASIDISQRKHMEERLRLQVEEIEGLRRKLERENIYLRQEIELQHVHDEIVGGSPRMRQTLAKVEQVARTDTTVLIEGETGTGKELLAMSVHRLSARKQRPLVTVNCASLPPTLIESELFGREKGAYTGALTRMAGRFEVADRGTLFLDEIGELPLDVQAKLLRVLEQGRFERLGSNRTLQVDVRIIAATNQHLSQQVAAGRFRKDLFYRLNVFPITLPPLRERAEDIPSLVWAFVRQYEKKMGKRVDHIPRKSMDNLQHYAWPGNVRELRNVIERALIGCVDRTLDVRVPQDAFPEAPEGRNLEDTERRHILSVLKQTGWRLSGPGGAADILGLKRTTLHSKMKKLGIRRSPLGMP
ncbi:MAG: sigma 54-interacting transcriptional regulator [Desulfobacterales bacterium]|nr:sigma 54-interacting transcriptional regulator [Desulfobacterales bacterium]